MQRSIETLLYEFLEKHLTRLAEGYSSNELTQEVTPFLLDISEADTIQDIVNKTNSFSFHVNKIAPPTGFVEYQIGVLSHLHIILASSHKQLQLGYLREKKTHSKIVLLFYTDYYGSSFKQSTIESILPCDKEEIYLRYHRQFCPLQRRKFAFEIKNLEWFFLDFMYNPTDGIAYIKNTLLSIASANKTVYFCLYSK